MTYMQDPRSTNPCKYREMASQTASDGKHMTFEGGTTDFDLAYRCLTVTYQVFRQKSYLLIVNVY